ncbi:MAG TPA: hypothetical protein VEH84_07165 [Alphaproteobacteria bacterium]|nr:hypothetical protein [Alphaproteobacteria bacterium]
MPPAPPKLDLARLLPPDAAVPGEAQRRLVDYLSGLPPAAAARVASVIETARATGEDGLPYSVILDSLRPHLRLVRPKRLPTLQRLAAEGFEPFLTHEEGGPKRRGLIPRRLIQPWWALVTGEAANHLLMLEAVLTAAVKAEDWAQLDEIGQRARTVAAEGTRRLLARLAGQSAEARAAALRLGGLDRLEELEEIGAILAVAEPLRAALATVSAVAAREQGYEAGPLTPIAEFSPQAVTTAKALYHRLGEELGPAVEWFALGLLGRLSKPWQILRLARALGWRMDEALPQHAGIASAAERLLADAEALVQQATRLALRGAAPLPPEQRLGMAAGLVAAFAAHVAGTADEAQIPKDSPWAARIGDLRRRLTEPVDTLLAEAEGLILAAVPQARIGMSNGRPQFGPALDAVPSPEAAAAARAGAGLIRAVLAHGERHGLAAAARRHLAEIEAETDRRAEALFDALRKSPGAAPPLAQLAVLCDVADALLPRDRAEVLRRRARSHGLTA